MPTLLFRDTYSQNPNQQIVKVESESLEKFYSICDCYFENTSFEENLEDYRKERNFEVKTEGKTLTEIKEQITDFQENQYEYTCEVNNCSYNGRPKKVLQTDDEDIVSESTASDYYSDEQLTEEAYETCEGITEWDGSNHVTTYYRGYYAHQFEELDYEDLDFEEIHSTRNGQGQGHTEIEYCKKNDLMLEVVVSYWQGVGNSIQIIEGDQKNYYKAIYLSDEKALEELNNELTEGEFTLDEESLVFNFQDEEYHISENEMSHDNGYDIEFHLDEGVKVAKEAIFRRKMESVDISDIDTTKVWVSYSDSINSGNCVEISIRVMNVLKMKTKAVGAFALRADELLKYRDDEYTHRAIQYSHLNRY